MLLIWIYTDEKDYKMGSSKTFESYFHLLLQYEPKNWYDELYIILDMSPCSAQ